MKKYINWGIIGLGNAARAFSSGFQNSFNSKLFAVASKSTEKRIFFKKKFNLENEYVFTNYEDLIKSKDVDIVYIALPHSMHKEWCIKSAILKKHILVEKPATLKLSDIEEIINAVKLNNVFFAEGLTFRYHPFFLQILSTIKKIHPNKIKHISASFGNDAIGGKKIFGLRLKRPNKNKRLFNPDLGGGAIWDAGCYPTSLVRELISVINKNNLNINPLIIDVKKKYGSTGVDEYSSIKLKFHDITTDIEVSINKKLDNKIKIKTLDGEIIINEPWFPSTRSYIQIINNKKSELINCENIINSYQSEIETISSFLINNKKELSYPLPNFKETIDNVSILEKWKNYS
tara:strand:- start:127 stop:1164 length:1038 start_codon:yes stop_codon:yes gene_type:complete